MRQVLLAIALAGALASCSDETNTGPYVPPPPGCDTLLGTCWTNAALPTLDAQTACENAWGTWVASCPMSDTVGMCTETTGRVTYYYASGFVTFQAEIMCGGLGGSFTPLGRRVTASCEWPTDGICLDIEGTESDVQVLGPQVCADDAPSGVPGTWHASGSCASGALLGTCSFPIYTLDVDARVNVGSPLSSEAEAMCAYYEGTWRPY